jgi:uncharacterized protein YggU (UPF0235/DUF167 family)
MSESRKFRMHDGKTGAALALRIVPRSRQNEVAEIMNDGTVKIRLVHAENDEATNQSLLQFMAEVLEVKPEQIELVAGSTGRDKLITVMNLDAETLQHRIVQRLA